MNFSLSVSKFPNKGYYRRTRKFIPPSKLLNANENISKKFIRDLESTGNGIVRPARVLLMNETFRKLSETFRKLSETKGCVEFMFTFNFL